MDNAEAREWLDTAWSAALAAEATDPDPAIDRLVNSKVTSIRYAVITQLLGKVANPDRSLVYLQSGTDEPGAWNARSFCDSVVVPWVTENHDVIGTSSEPYASKPLRRLRLERDMPDVRNKAEWAALFDFFDPLDHATPVEAQKALTRCLESVARRLSGQTFKYQIPLRVSLPGLRQALETFLGESSGGFRPLAVTAAMMRVLGRGFSIFSRVTSQGVNEADAASGAPGDVMCYDEDDHMILAVEVKDRELTLSDVKAFTRKARESDKRLSNLLFAAPSIREREIDSIHDAVAAAWASGQNVYQMDIIDLAVAAFVLLSEEWRPELLREIGKELDDRGDHAHRKAWQDRLVALAEQN